MSLRSGLSALIDPFHELTAVDERCPFLELYSENFLVWADYLAKA